jgi:hypothetical protein
MVNNTCNNNKSSVIKCDQIIPQDYHEICQGSALKGWLRIDRIASWVKEIWFPSGYTGQRDKVQITDNPILGRWIGWRVVMYNDKAVEMESCLDDQDNNQEPIYPCQIVNKIECTYEKGRMANANARFDVEDLFNLEKMAFAVEIALATAQKDSSTIQLRNKQDLYHVLTDNETFKKILEQGLDEENQIYNDGIVDYFMNIKDKAKLEELRFYPPSYPYI